MRARKYNKRIDVYQVTNVSDGFGGNGVGVPTLIARSWCKLITLNKLDRNTDVGIIDTIDTIVIQLRKRNDLDYNSKNMYFVYRSEKYIMQSEPINVGFEDREIQITLKRESKKGTTSSAGNQHQHQNQHGSG